MDLQGQLVLAAGLGDKDSVISLLSQGAEIRDFGALRRAALNGHADMVLLLINHGANIEDIEPRNSFSVLMSAVGQGQMDFIEALLDSGANVNHSFYGTTPLLYAIARNKPEIAAILLKHGANVNAAYRSLYTPLHISILYGRFEIVKLLVAIPGIEINAMDRNSQTPLHVASKYNLIKTVRLLLQNGADPYLRDNNGLTASDLCSDRSSDVAKEIKLFQLSRQEHRGMKNKITELETQNKKRKKMFEETKKPEVELEEKEENLKRQLKRKEDSEDVEKMEGVL